MKVHSIRHDWPEKGGFHIDRPNGADTYTFLHFQNSMRIKINESILVTKPGACIFYAPGYPQWFASDADILHDWAHFNEGFKRELVNYGIKENELYYPSDTDFIRDLFRKAELEYFLSDFMGNDLIDTYITQFLILFSRAVRDNQVRSEVGKAETERLKKIRKEILTHSEKHWKIADMAELCHLSQSRFHVVYKSLFGISPFHDIISARIRKAENLLLTSDCTLSEAAQILGYSSEYHLIRQFKQITGKTPGSYRKCK